jgi:methionyl-tRNA formyltransferase
VSRLVYLGTPEAAVPPLEGLVRAGHDVALVVTRPDKRRGRGSATQPTPVKAAAERLGIPVTERVDDVIDAHADLGVVVAFGRLIKPPVLGSLPLVNLHFSLLPRWRGAAPVERAILAGDATTGVCLMELEAGLDTGPVYACREVEIGDRETATDLRARLTDIGTTVLVDELASGLGVPTPQDGEPTYAAKIEPAELRLDWTQPAAQLDRVVRVGPAWTTFRGNRLRVVRAQPVDAGPASGVLDGVTVGTGDGKGLELLAVKPEGRAEQAASAWRNGARPHAGERLGD